MAKGNQYLPLSRKWKKGDVITFHLPMKVSVEQIPDKKDYYAFLYGPIVLAASTGTEHLDGLYADDSRGGHIAHGKQNSSARSSDADRKSRFNLQVSSERTE